MKSCDTLIYERKYIEKGAKYIAGIDEAGRGPLAGPVVVAIAVMPLNDIIDGVDDSKKLSEKKREKLYGEIIAKAIAYKIVAIDNQTIDIDNILNATKSGMLQCIKTLGITTDIVLIDAVKLNTEVPYEAIVHGDALSYSIASASILAKVYRDRLMREYDKVYPEYGFAKHKGYGTAEHIAALRAHGVTPIHRHSFIKGILSEQ